MESREGTGTALWFLESISTTGLEAKRGLEGVASIAELPSTKHPYLKLVQGILKEIHYLAAFAALVYRSPRSPNRRACWEGRAGG